MTREQILKKKIRKNISSIYKLRDNDKKFVPGKSWVQYSGSYFDDREVNEAVDAYINGWFGLGKKGQKMENKMAHYLGMKGSVLTNSGSSASLLSIASLTSPMSPFRLQPGDEIITAACGFPTTVNPIIQYGLVPVFLDVDPETLNINPKDLEKALSKKTRAVFVAHTLGNPNDIDGIMKFCKKHNLIFIEDNCDALGSTWNGKRTGGFGTLSTLSFYPAHHMTIGEGGMVSYNDVRFERIIKSFRDWGRSCWCRGDDRTMEGACGVRFNYKVGGLPYDHKYMFNHIGYNLKPIEPQAAFGLEQIKRVPFFVKKRKENFKRLASHTKRWGTYFTFAKALPKADPSWFAFPMTIRKGVPFTRHDITLFLEKHKIQTRPVFAGNILRQPAYFHIKHRKVGSFINADHILHNTFFVGVYPGLGKSQIDYMAEKIETFLKKYE